jgi:hypothetical protein
MSSVSSSPSVLMSALGSARPSAPDASFQIASSLKEAINPRY